jgi:putative SOS response-associated peptidase YedK
MCVRYTLHKTDAALLAISKALGVLLGTPDWAVPRYNVTLTSSMPVVALGADKPEVRRMTWGIVPASDRGKSHPRLLANARSETVTQTSAFRSAVAKRRCLVPANGYYEWKSVGGVKLPHLFTLKDEEPFALAGIWDTPFGDTPETYCLLTTHPNELAARVHDRMPVILTNEDMGRWIGDTPLSPETLASIIAPISPDRMQSRPVSRYVSNSRHEGPECLAPPAEVPPEPEFDFG